MASSDWHGSYKLDGCGVPQSCANHVRLTVRMSTTTRAITTATATSIQINPAACMLAMFPPIFIIPQHPIVPPMPIIESMPSSTRRLYFAIIPIFLLPISCPPRMTFTVTSQLAASSR